jgi:hypothetical protein
MFVSVDSEVQLVIFSVVIFVSIVVVIAFNLRALEGTHPVDVPSCVFLSALNVEA